MAENNVNRANEREQARKELKAVFGAAEHEAVPMFEDAPCYPEADLVELYWIGYGIEHADSREERIRLVEKYDQKRRSIKKLPDAPERIYIWPDGAIPCLTDDYTDNSDHMYNHDPDFRPYFFEMLVDDDVTPKGLVIFCAGGDHGYAMFHEAYQSCKDFNRMGYQAILVANRTNRCPWNAVDAAADVSRTIRLVRMNASKYRIPEDRVAVCGFSNGGVTAENVIRYFSGEKKMTDYYPGYAADEADRFYGSPDAYLCLYGPRHAGSEFDYEGVEYPPTFFAVGREDRAWHNLNALYPQLVERGIPVEIHTFAGVPHGKAGVEILDGKVKYPNFQMWLPLADWFLMDLWRSE